MADWDTTDLVTRCQRMRRRPSTDEATTTAQWYAMLTEAEAHWKPVIASHYPNDMYSAPVLLTSSDSGVTYTLPSSEVDPIALEVYPSLTGELLMPGAFWDVNADYVQEEGKIRMPGNRPRTFSDGPYARYVAGPAALDASTDSTIKPKHLRTLLVHYACMLDASRGGMDDPAFYRSLMQIEAFGDPLIPGDIGLIGALKKRNAQYGVGASRGGSWKARWMYPNNG